MNQNYHCILYGKTPVPKKSLDEARSSSAFDILDLEMVFGILQYCCFDNQNYHCVFDDKTPVPKKCLKLAKTIHMTSFVTIATV